MLMEMVNVKVYNCSGNPLPKYETLGSAGMDVRAMLSEPIILSPGSSVIVPTGLHVEIPQGYEIQVRSRSGLAAKKRVFVLNSPGTIDSDYRNGIGVILMNLSKFDFVIENGDRIAQLVLNEVPQINWVPVTTLDDLSSTDRGMGGFGSTNTK